MRGPSALVCAAISLAACGLAACGDDSGGGSPDASTTPGPDATPADAPPVITPDDPGPADLRFEIDSSQRHSVSRFIYGVNGADFAAHPYLTATRSGGNRMTAYNWENNASNAGTDYLNENDDYLGGGDVPAEVVRAPAADAFAHDASIAITVPIQGYVAADKGPGGDVNQTPSYLTTRFKQNRAKKGAAFSLTPDTSDGFVYEDELVSFLETKLPGHHGTPTQNFFYCLDNEPDLWASTHPRIHPNPVTYDEELSLSVEFAGAVKDVAPQAFVLGPVSYGWNGYVTLQDAPDAGGRDFLEFYLDGMKTADTSQGRRLLDALDLHWYPEATGNGVRITEDDASAPVAAARVQAPRSLWDAAYTETSWITQYSTMGPIRLIPRMRDKIAAHYPGTRLSISEYYYGGGADISGGIAEADVLGVFGREGVFFAALWHVGSTDDRFIYGGFRMFRDYDGQGGAFGDTGVSATTDSDQDSSVYASLVGENKMVIVAINRSGASKTAGLRIMHGVAFKTATPYVLTSASPNPVAGAPQTIDKVNALVVTLPANSVTTFVLTP
jgi:hypothetical protein